MKNEYRKSMYELSKLLNSSNNIDVLDVVLTVEDIYGEVSTNNMIDFCRLINNFSNASHSTITFIVKSLCMLTPVIYEKIKFDELLLIIDTLSLTINDERVVFNIIDRLVKNGISTIDEILTFDISKLGMYHMSNIKVLKYELSKLKGELV